MNRFTLLIAFLFFPAVPILFSQATLFDQQMQIGFEEKQGQYVALDTKLVNEKGDTVLLGNVIDKPTLLSLVYFRCPGTCSPLMWGISKSIDAVDLQAGQEYQVITISFDYTETIDLGIRKKSAYISSMTKKEAGDHWLFFVSDSANIAKLTQSVGFGYKLINNQYVHPTGLIAIASDGKITRYMRGIDFLPFDVKITMIEAANGKIGPSINRLLAVCYSYDEQGNQFVFNVLKVSGILIMFIASTIFLFLLYTSRKNTKKEIAL